MLQPSRCRFELTESKVQDLVRKFAVHSCDHPNSAASSDTTKDSFSSKRTLCSVDTRRAGHAVSTWATTGAMSPLMYIRPGLIAQHTPVYDCVVDVCKNGHNSQLAQRSSSFKSGRFWVGVDMLKQCAKTQQNVCTHIKIFVYPGRSDTFWNGANASLDEPPQNDLQCDINWSVMPNANQKYKQP